MYQTPEIAIQPLLERKEKILWSGQPSQGIQFRAQDVFLIPFSLMWGGFAIFWEYSVIKTAAPFFFTIWGIPFVIIGLYMIFGRFITDSKQRENTYYGVTNDRIIIVQGLVKQKIKSLNLRTLSDVTMSQKNDGSGSISFGPGNPIASWLIGTSWPGIGANFPPSFDAIPNVSDVYRTIMDAQKK